MLDNDVTVFQTNYLRVRRNALGNILEGLDQRALAWLAECVSNIDGGHSEQPEISENEDQEAPTDEEGGPYISLNVDIETNKRGTKEIDAEKSSQLELDSKEEIFIRATELASPFVKSCFQLPSFTTTRRNALHDLLETLTPAELAKLKQLYLLQLTIESDDDHPTTLMAGRPRQLGSIIPHFGKFATHVWTSPPTKKQKQNTSKNEETNEKND